MKHREGVWYVKEYVDGWFFYTATSDGNLGPYKTFEAGLKPWAEAKKKHKIHCIGCNVEILVGAYCSPCQKKRVGKY